MRIAAHDGDYPNALSDLDADLQQLLPTDPINGQPFGYLLTPDSADAMPFAVYSYGIDGIDNGGSPYGTDKERFAPLRDAAGNGYDAVIGPFPRPPLEPLEPEYDTSDHG